MYVGTQKFSYKNKCHRRRVRNLNLIKIKLKKYFLLKYIPVNDMIDILTSNKLHLRYMDFLPVNAIRRITIVVLVPSRSEINVLSIRSPVPNACRIR